MNHWGQQPPCSPVQSSFSPSRFPSRPPHSGGSVRLSRPLRMPVRPRARSSHRSVRPTRARRSHPFSPPSSVSPVPRPVSTTVPASFCRSQVLTIPAFLLSRRRGRGDRDRDGCAEDHRGVPTFEPVDVRQQIHIVRRSQAMGQPLTDVLRGLGSPQGESAYPCRLRAQAGSPRPPSRCTVPDDRCSAVCACDQIAQCNCCGHGLHRDRRSRVPQHLDIQARR